ncbi:MAG: anti-ECFsigma factor, ChrR [Bryobacterales bacterium]|nr:anti-ECFsigma factor, ChrR [Bryobacterales bacterium]
MTCDQAKTRMTEYWSLALGEAEQKEFSEHLASCEACRSEVSRIGALWQSLDLLPVEEPSGKVRERFYEMLGAYRQGLASVETRKGEPWWRKPVWQIAAAAAVLAIGMGIGYGVRGGGQPPGEVSQLREEVANMRQLVALSLLQQQSASERLRGVSWSYQVEPSDKEVLNALVTAVNHDPNVNVRLAAVDALRPFTGSPATHLAARNAVVQALPKQTVPIVQVALIDFLAELKERNAAPELRRLVSDPDIDSGVRKRAEWALERMQ